MSGLIGIHPPLRTMTVKLANNPSPSVQKPGVVRLAAANPNNKACDDTRITGITISGICRPMAGVWNAIICGRTATNTSQPNFSLIGFNFLPVNFARSMVRRSPAATAERRITYDTRPFTPRLCNHHRRGRQHPKGTTPVSERTGRCEHHSRL